MKRTKADIDCELMIIGTGMAGMAAALFASEAGIKTILAGQTGQLNFASGLIDLLGVHPVAQGLIAKNPWKAIESLGRDKPDHPLSRIDVSQIKTSINIFLKFMRQAGYPYLMRENKNMIMPTSAGTVKPTYAIAHTMSKAPEAMERNEPCLIIDFKGLKGFSSRQISENLNRSWPGLRPVSIEFPRNKPELLPEPMALALETSAMREKLAHSIAPHLRDVCSVALPAILGIYRTVEVAEDLSRRLGVPVFEIPTMVPGVAGIRIKEIFQQHLPNMGVTTFFQHRVKKIFRKNNNGWVFEVSNLRHSQIVSARAVVVCTGRFLGGGLHGDRHEINETVFNLPVAQPPGRSFWHNRNLLHPGGHPINRAGLGVDNRFRPVDNSHRPAYPDLFAAGTILAGQDWMREKCGSGLSIATAYAAVRAARRFLGKT